MFEWRRKKKDDDGLNWMGRKSRGYTPLTGRSEKVIEERNKRLRDSKGRFISQSDADKKRK